MRLREAGGRPREKSAFKVTIICLYVFGVTCTEMGFELTKEQEKGNNTNTEVLLKYFTVLLYLPSRSASESEFLLFCVCVYIYIYAQIGI